MFCYSYSIPEQNQILLLLCIAWVLLCSAVARFFPGRMPNFHGFGCPTGHDDSLEKLARIYRLFTAILRVSLFYNNRP